MKNAKAKGSQRELKTMERLGDKYLCTKSGGSLGVFDIIALHANGVRCIQVKSNCWPSPAERKAMAATINRLPVNATVECWRWDNYAREPKIRFIEEFKEGGAQ